MGDRATEDRGPMYLNFTIAMTVITIVAIALRFWSRLLGPTDRAQAFGRFWWDDWFALLALPMIIALFTLQFIMLQHGLGKHVEFVEGEDLAIFAKLVYANYFTYDFALCFTKASALFFLQRVFVSNSNGKTWFRWAVWAAHAINVAWLVGIVFATVFMCDPIAKGWNPALEGSCGDTKALWVGSAIPSVVIDLIILLLPMPMIWGLQMNQVKKIAITVVFFLGYCVVVVSLGRLINLFLSGDGLNEDITYEAIPVSLWVAAEAPATMLSICLPAMLPLGRHLGRTYFSPLASSVSSLWSTHKRGDSYVRSRSGAFPYNSNASHGSRGDKPSMVVGTMTTDSSTHIRRDHHDGEPYDLGLIPGHSSYEVRAELQSRSRDNSGEEGLIRVERDVKVSRI